MKNDRTEIMRNFAHEVRLEMTRSGMKDVDLARKMGKSRGEIGYMLNGSRNLTLKTIADICNALDVQFNIELVEKNEVVNGTIRN